MEVVVNTVKRRRKPNDDEQGTGLKKAFVPRSAKDLAKMQFDKLMKDPDKPVNIPNPKKEWKPREPAEFVRHVMGSSAGAGSGEFHVYRGIRERETKRNEYLDKKAKEEAADKEYQDKLDMDKKLAEERTAKLRKKREKKKRNKMKNKKKPTEINTKEITSPVECEDSEDSEKEDEHFVIGGK